MTNTDNQIPAPSAESSAVHRSPTGRTVVMSFASRDELTVFGPSGEVELTLRFTPEGPVLSMAAARLELSSTGTVAVNCEDLELNARRSMRLTTGEDLVQDVGGSATTRARDRAEVVAGDVRIASERGEIQVEGAGDTWITSPNVLINCDRETEMSERAWRAAEDKTAELAAKRDAKLLAEAKERADQTDRGAA